MCRRLSNQPRRAELSTTRHLTFGIGSARSLVFRGHVGDADERTAKTVAETTITYVFSGRIFAVQGDARYSQRGG
jgi:hypothetical protein